MIQEKLITPKEAARALGITLGGVYSLVASYRLRALHSSNGRIRIQYAEVRNYITTREKTRKLSEVR